MPKAIVTGGAGFIGSFVVDNLIDKNFDVFVIDNLSTGNVGNLNKKIFKNRKFYFNNILNEEISEIFAKERPNYVFHLAAQINVRKSIKDPIEDSKTNILGSLNILNCCVKSGVEKIIFSSSGGAIYSDGCKIPSSELEEESPMSPYGIAKLSVEKYLEFYKNVHGLDYVSLRYSNVYGPRQNSGGEAGVVSIFINKILSGKNPLINGSGEQTRDYIFVKDVSDANIMALNLSGIFNVGTGKETSVNELFKKIAYEMNYNQGEVHGPEINGEIMTSCLDAGKLRSQGWSPKYDLDSGLKETINYFKELKLSHL